MTHMGDQAIGVISRRVSMYVCICLGKTITSSATGRREETSMYCDI